MQAAVLRKAGEPSRLVAGLSRRGCAPAPTPAGLEARHRRQDECGRHLGRSPRAPPHGRPSGDCRRRRLGRHGRGRRLGRLGRRAVPLERAGRGTAKPPSAPARAARRCGARASFAPPRARRSTPLVDVHLEHTRRPRGREWRRGDPSRSERGRESVRASRGPRRPRTARPPPGSSLASSAGEANSRRCHAIAPPSVPFLFFNLSLSCRAPRREGAMVIRPTSTEGPRSTRACRPWPGAGWSCAAPATRASSSTRSNSCGGATATGC